MILCSEGREAEAPFLRRLQQLSLGVHAAGAHTGSHRDLPGALGARAYTSVGIRTVDGGFGVLSGVSCLLLALSGDSSCVFDFQQVFCLAGAC